MYKLASQQQLRVQTSKGLLSIEQLWDLSIEELDIVAVELEREYQSSGKKSFVVKSTAKDRNVKLKFDIVLDILTTKVEDRDLLQQKAADKEHNSKILELISEKQDESLKGKTVKQLEAMLR